MTKNDFDPLSLVRENIRSLTPYSTARDEYGGPLGVYLDANESPYDNGFNRYPDPYQKRLKARIAEMKGVTAERIFLGNGSDEAIDLALRIFCEPGRDNVVSMAPTYGMYRVAAAVNDIQMREVRVGDDHEPDAEALLGRCDRNTKLMFICSPNNPTGMIFPEGKIEHILEKFGGIVIVDEAYIDFAPGCGLIPRLDEFPNLVVLQTLSKAYAMAGLRLGMAFASAEITGLFTRIKYPYNINGPTQETVLALLEKDIGPRVAETISERESMAAALARMDAVKRVWPSQANFLLVRFDDPREVYEYLIKKGIIVRDRSGEPGCEGCLRISIGTPEENLRLLEALGSL